MKTKRLQTLLVAALACVLTSTTTHAQTAPKNKMTTDIPPFLTTPDTVETRIGTLKFTDGFPDNATVEKCYDNLAFQRSVGAYLAALPAISTEGARRAVPGLGPANQTVLISETPLHSKSLFLPASTTTPYTVRWLHPTQRPPLPEIPSERRRPLGATWSGSVTDRA